MTREDRELIEARDECVRLGLLKKQGKNLNGVDAYVKTEKGERVFKELLKRHRDEKYHNNARQYKEIASRNCYAATRQQANKEEA